MRLAPPSRHSPAQGDLPKPDVQSLQSAKFTLAQRHPESSGQFSTFINGTDNVLLIGGTRTRKSHLASALGIQAVEHHRKMMRLFSTVNLVNALDQEKAANKVRQMAERLIRLDLLILDDLGYLSFSTSDGAAPFHLLSTLYEQTSVVISTNLRFAEWAEVFGAAKITTTFLDQLTHYCDVLETGNDSFRFKSGAAPPKTDDD